MSAHFAGLVLLVAVVASGQTIEGTWQGTLNAGALKLRLAIHILRNSKGALVTKLDSLDQGINGIPVRETKFTSGKLYLDVPDIRATYDGMLDGDQITGSFTQGASIPLVFKRVDKIETLNRPQNPQPPFPYESADVAYENRAAGVKLAGTSDHPARGRPLRGGDSDYGFGSTRSG